MIQRAARKPRVAAAVKPKTSPTTVSARTTTTPAPAPAAPSPAPRPPVVRRWPPGEYPLYQKALADSADPKQQLVDLEVWRQRYPTTEHEADRIYLYIGAFNRFAPPPLDKLVEFAAPLVARDPHTWFDDSDTGRAQALAVLYMVTASAPRLPAASPSGLRTCHKAAHELLAYLPEFFDNRARPSGISQQLWEKARADMESVANQTLALRSAPSADKR